MAVIITNMDMPLCCKECCVFDGEYGECRYSSNVKITWDEEDGRPKDCPLKSTDEMIEEIEKLHAWGDQFGNVYVTFEAVMDIIHKYCDKESEKK